MGLAAVVAVVVEVFALVAALLVVLVVPVAVWVVHHHGAPWCRFECGFGFGGDYASSRMRRKRAIVAAL